MTAPPKKRNPGPLYESGAPGDQNQLATGTIAPSGPPSQLPAWAAVIVNSPPPSGEGFHPWLLRAALALTRCQWSASDIRAFLDTAAAACGRHVSTKEIADTIDKAASMVRFDSMPIRRTPKWPAHNRSLIESVCREHGVLVDLWEASPFRLEGGETAENFIDALFPGNPLLCCGQSNSSFSTLHREEWRGGLSALQLIVPSPMTAKTGLTQEGKASEHTLANTGERRFLIIEFDTGTVDQHAARLLHLAEYAPMVLAVHSGGKSLHGWFYCIGQTEHQLRRFMEYAVTLGADSATWTRSQFVRIPEGTRDNGKRQAVYFFNPGLIL
jgi:hypothetical protein